MTYITLYVTIFVIHFSTAINDQYLSICRISLLSCIHVNLLIVNLLKRDMFGYKDIAPNMDMKNNSK